MLSLAALFRSNPRLRAAGMVLALVACLLRSALPAGFMPVSDGAGITISLCDGNQHAASITLAGDHAADHGASHDAPCPYAVLSLALDHAAPAPQPAPAALPAFIAPRATNATVPPDSARYWRPPGRAPPSLA